MRVFKKATALLLAGIMAFSSVNVNVFADDFTIQESENRESENEISQEIETDSNTIEGNIYSKESSEDEIKAVGNNVIGDLIAEEINSSPEAANALAENKEYAVTELTVKKESKTVKAKYSVLKDSYLIVGVYDDDGIKMYDSKTVKISSDNHESYVIFNKAFPDHFLLKGYIVEEGTMAPLSAVYECNTYTELMQVFYDKKITDFPEKDVVNLDGSDESNYIVFNDDIKLVSYDKETGANKVILGKPQRSSAKTASAAVEEFTDDEEILSQEYEVTDEIRELSINEELSETEDTTDDISEEADEFIDDSAYIEDLGEELVREIGEDFRDTITVLNATEEMLKSAKGDIVCVVQDKNALLFEIEKVESKTKTSITIKPKAVSFDQVFDYIDIDTTKIEGKRGSLSSGLKGSWGVALDLENNAASGNANLTNTLRFDLTALAADYSQSGLGNKDGSFDISASITGDLTVVTSIDFRFAYSKSSLLSKSVKDVRVTVDNDITAHANFTAAFNAEIPLGSYPIYPIPCVGIVVEPSIVLEAGITIDVTVTQHSRIGFEAGSNGFTDLSEDGKPTVSDFKAEGRVYIGLKTVLKIGITLYSQEVLTVNLTGELGVEIKATLYINGISSEQKCCCSKCIDGDISIIGKASVSLNIFLIAIPLGDIPSKSLKVLDFYLCLDDKCPTPKFQLTECPHRKISLTFHVKDEDGKAIQGASVVGGAGGKSETKTTDESGNVVFEVIFCEGDNMSFRAKFTKATYESKTVDIATTEDKETNVILEEVPVTIKLTFKDKSTGEVIPGLAVSGAYNIDSPKGETKIDAVTDSKGVCQVSVKKGRVKLSVISNIYDVKDFEFDNDVQADVTTEVKLTRIEPDYSKLKYSIGSNGHIYSYDGTATYDHYAGASSIAERYGAHLVTITDAEEQGLVQRFTYKHSNGVSYNFVFYLGGRLSDGQWKWSTGEKFEYNNLNPKYNRNKSPYTDLILRRDGTWEDYHYDASYPSPFVCTYNTYYDHNGIVLLEWDEFSSKKPADILPLLDPKNVYEDLRTSINESATEEVINNQSYTEEAVLEDLPDSSVDENILAAFQQPSYNLYKNSDTGLCVIEATGAEALETYNVYGVKKGEKITSLEELKLLYINQVVTNVNGAFELSLIPTDLSEEILYLFVPASAAGKVIKNEEEKPSPKTPVEEGKTELEKGDTPPADTSDRSGLWVSKIEDQIYIGKALKPKPNVYFGRKKLVEGVDYTLSYKNNKNKSISSNALSKQPTVIIIGKGNYKDKKTVYFGIKEANKEDTKVALEKYNKELKEASQKITITKENLVIKADEITNGVAAIKGSVTFEPDVFYNDGKNLVRLYKGKDYTVSFSNNTKAVADKEAYEALNKKPTIKITGKGKYKGFVTENFMICMQDIGNLIMTVNGAVGTSANNYVTKVVIYDLNGKALKAGTDYYNTIEYVSIDKPDAMLNPKATKKDRYTADKGEKIKVTVTGKGNYAGSISKEYTVSSFRFNSAKFAVLSKEYCNKKITLTVEEILAKWKKDSKKPVPEFDIDVASYMNNVNKGSAMVVITGKGEYGGDIVYKYQITPMSIK